MPSKDITRRREASRRYRQTPKGRAANRRHSARQRHRKQALCDGLKAAWGCNRCGYRGLALDFHHQRPGVPIAGGSKLSMPQLLTEIAKCEVLCANCHAEETRNS